MSWIQGCRSTVNFINVAIDLPRSILKVVFRIDNAVRGIEATRAARNLDALAELKEGHSAAIDAEAIHVKSVVIRGITLRR